MRGEEGSTGSIDPSLLNLLVLRVLSLFHLRYHLEVGREGKRGRGGGGLRSKLVQSQKKEENCPLGGGKGKEK